MRLKRLLCLAVVLLVSLLVVAPVLASDPVVLDPTGAGSVTNIPVLAGAPTHWQANLTYDGDTSYVASNAGAFYDLYALENVTVGTNVIDFIEVRVVVGGGGTARSAIKTGGVVYYGSIITLTGGYATFVTTYQENPNTTADWTEADVNGMEIGVELTMGATNAKCTQVYVVVSYEVNPTESGDQPEVLPLPEDEDFGSDTGVVSSLPYYDLVNPAAILLGWDDNTLYGVLAIFVAIGLGVGVAIATSSGMLAAIAVGIGLAVGVATGAVGLWVVVAYIAFAGSYLVVSRSM